MIPCDACHSPPFDSDEGGHQDTYFNEVLVQFINLLSSVNLILTLSGDDGDGPCEKNSIQKVVAIMMMIISREEEEDLMKINDVGEDQMELIMVDLKFYLIINVAAMAISSSYASFNAY